MVKVFNRSELSAADKKLLTADAIDWRAERILLFTIESAWKAIPKDTVDAAQTLLAALSGISDIRYEHSIPIFLSYNMLTLIFCSS